MATSDRLLWITRDPKAQAELYDALLFAPRSHGGDTLPKRLRSQRLVGKRRVSASNRSLAGVAKLLKIGKIPDALSCRFRVITYGFIVATSKRPVGPHARGDLKPGRRIT